MPKTKAESGGAAVAEAGKPVAGKSSAKKPVEGSNAARTARETVESIVIAFILAFLFRTFEAEAFVIPTGSMAPTLQGRHKDVDCPKCGYRYRIGASGEAPDEERGPRERRVVVSGACPMCGYKIDVGPPETPAGDEYPTHNGDRIIVGKFPYDLGDPERWDVVVFKFPEEARQNYIKRLIGLPGEEVMIGGGDIYTRKLGTQDPFQIARKPAKKLLAMLQPVYDNDYVVDELLDWGWPPRWQPWQEPSPTSAEQGWVSNDKFRSFETALGGSQAAWLRYQHILPAPSDWAALQKSVTFAQWMQQRRPQLRWSDIHDFYVYNWPNPPNDRSQDGNFVAGDLFLECELTPQKAEGVVELELVEDGARFQCRLDLANNQATLQIPALPDYKPTAALELAPDSAHKIGFGNIDDQLVLFLDGTPVDFNADTAYDPGQGLVDPGAAQGTEDPNASPVGIGSLGASVKVNHLRVMRDIVYLGQRDDGTPPFLDPIYYPLAQFPDDPGRDQFFVLGDNCPQSQDSRLWSKNHYVERNLMIGKAFYIYWPHSFNRIPGTRIPFPMFPNFSRMGLVR